MDPLKILVCDDIDPYEIGGRIKAGASAAQVEILEPDCWDADKLKDVLEGFFDRVRKLVEGEKEGHETAFDGYDLIFVDNNLGWIPIRGAKQTAASIVGYLRSLADCRYVVELNRNELTDFDLDHLIGDEETKADQALNSEHLEIADLWKFEKLAEEAEFLPWYWPEMVNAAKFRQEQWKQVETNLDRSVLDTLNFPPEAIAALSREATTFLNPTTRGEENTERKPIEETSFWDVARGCGHSMNFDDRTAIYTGSKQPKRAEVEDFVRRGKLPEDPLLKRFAVHTAAAEIEFWLRRHVLGPQNILIDAPHLQSALRFRCGENTSDVAVWNETVTAANAGDGFDPEVAALAKDHSSDLEIWLHRPTYWWPRIQADARLAELRKQGASNPTFVFCEDTRRFHDRSSDQVERFVPNFGIPAPRFIKNIAGKNYEPRTRLAE